MANTVFFVGRKSHPSKGLHNVTRLIAKSAHRSFLNFETTRGLLPTLFSYNWGTALKVVENQRLKIKDQR